MEDLQIAFKEARSFPGLTPPNNAKFLGKIETKCDVVNIYKDQYGNLWYDTESGRKFEIDIQEKMEKRRKEKRRSKRQGKIA